MLKHRVVAVAVALGLVLAGADLAAQSGETGVVTGVVRDAERGGALVGAAVRVEGTSVASASDRTGAFRLVGVPVGARQIAVSFLGRATTLVPVTVSAGQVASIAVTLPRSEAVNETVTVTAESIQEGQASALNQQKTALNITNIVSADQIGSFPDPNAAEAASRVPGVSIARDQGEGRYVLVRGTEARLNSMTIDGERIPAPEGDTRQVALDAVPADQLQALEVAKALTPDMDADSIGGAVNLVTRQAINRLTALGSIAGGYNALQQSGDQRRFSGVVGGRMAGGRAGLIVSFSGSSLTRGSENFEAEYDDGDLDDLQLRDYQIERQRYGVNVSGDVRLNALSTLTFKSLFNEFKDYEVNNRIRFRPSNRRIEHVLKNRNQNQHIRSVSVGGNHSIEAGRSMLDYKVSWAESKENQPDRLDTIFRQTNVNFAPNVSATSIDPENIQPNPSVNNASVARLNAWETEIFDTTDRDITASFNYRRPLGLAGETASFLKVGFKVRDKHKQRDFQLSVGTPTSAVLFPQLEDASFDNSRFLDFFPAGYTPFPGISASASRALFGALPASAIAIDREGDAEAYDADERVVAGYVMAEIYLGSRVTFVSGVRVESTRVDYAGNDVIYDEDGDYASTARVTGSDTRTFLLPGFHARFAVDEQTNIRAAYTRTLARPNYYDLVPYQLVFQEDSELSRGNSSLRPTSSHNLDLLAERYFRSVGVVSGGFFVKRLSDYIYPFRFSEAIFGDTYQVSQPQNGESATLWGAEFSLQNQLSMLSAPFDGLGVHLNYTLTDSSATFPDRSTTSALPGQSRHIGNVALWYEKHGFMSKVSWNFHGKYVDAVGGTEAEDVYYDNHTQLDISLSQRIGPRLQLFADFLNLTNAPLRYYQGTPNRPLQEEYYRWWTSVGAKVLW
jgi:TonB-dependent receptor